MAKKNFKPKGNKPRTPNVNVQPSQKGDPQSTLGSPFQTPPTSPSSAVGDLPLLDLTHREPQKTEQEQEKVEPVDSVDLSVTDIASKDIVAIADLTQSEPQKTEQEQEKVEPVDSVDLSVTDIASQDIVAIADLFSNMKKALVTMSSAFDSLGGQTEKMVSLTLDIKLQDQVCFQLLLALSSNPCIYRFSDLSLDWKNKSRSRKPKSRTYDSC